MGWITLDCLEPGLTLGADFVAPDGRFLLPRGVESYQRLRDRQRELTHNAEDAERRYQQIVSEAPLGIFQATPEGRYLFVNPEYTRLAGYTDPEEMVAQITDIATQIYANPADQERYRELLSRHEQVTGFEVGLKRREAQPTGKRPWKSLEGPAKPST